MATLTRSVLLASAVSAALSVAVEDPALAQEPTPMYVVTYFEVAPSMSTEARALLKAFRDASRKEEGTARVDALHRSERPNHFAIVETWKSPAAQEAHARSPHTKEFREKLQRLLKEHGTTVVKGSWPKPAAGMRATFASTRSRRPIGPIT